MMPAGRPSRTLRCLVTIEAGIGSPQAGNRLGYVPSRLGASRSTPSADLTLLEIALEPLAASSMLPSGEMLLNCAAMQVLWSIM